MAGMIKRIALSLTLLLYPLTLGACADASIVADDVADDDPTSADGIGTSPSDPEGLALLEGPREGGVIIQLAEQPFACGLWVDGDVAALGCAPADVAVWPSPATCSDLIRLADARWYGQAVVRKLDGQLRAVAAVCP